MAVTCHGVVVWCAEHSAKLVEGSTWLRMVTGWVHICTCGQRERPSVKYTNPHQHPAYSTWTCRMGHSDSEEFQVPVLEEGNKLVHALQPRSVPGTERRLVIRATHPHQHAPLWLCPDSSGTKDAPHRPCWVRSACSCRIR